MRVRAYVDGFNLYYRALKGTPHKWLDLFALAASLIDPADDLDLLRYFTAHISSRAGDPDAPRRQQIYLNALSSSPRITIHYGSFLAKTKWRPRVRPDGTPGEMVRVHDTEEKGSDVNLAVHMLNDGLRDHFDVALLFSQDTDLAEPMRLVREAGKQVGLICLDGRQANKRLNAHASFVRHLRPSQLAAAQLPDLIEREGKRIEKPTGW